MPTVPRPRPRPRVRPEIAMNKESSTEPSSAGPSNTYVHDEDALFIRNRNRNATGWKAINIAVEKNEQRRRSQSPSKGQASEPEDSDLDCLSRPKKRKGNERLPEWTRGDPTNVIQISSDENELEDYIYISDSPKSRPVEKKQKNRPAAERDRSCSLTPPPPAPVIQIQRAQNIITQIIGDASRRPPSPSIDIEDDDDGVELDPVLASIHARIRTRSPQATQAKDDPSNNVVVSIRIEWIPHPEDKNGRELRIGPVHIKRSEPFFELFSEIADHANVLVDDVVVTHNGTKVFAASSAATLHIWSEADFEACTISTYECNKQRQFAPAVSRVDNKTIAQTYESVTRGTSVGPPPDGDAASEDSASRQESQAPGGETFKIQLRSGSHCISVAVRPTTKCGAIISAFVRKAGLPASTEKTAWIADEEGKRMTADAEIGDEFEDGDLVDILGV